MNTRKALGMYSGQDIGDTFLSDPAVAERYAKIAAQKEARVAQRKAEPHASMAHLAAASRRAAELSKEALLDRSVPIVDKFSACQVAKRAASRSTDGGLKTLAKYLEDRWVADPTGSFSSSDLEKLRTHWEKSYGRTAALDVISNEIPNHGYGQLPVRKLSQLASQIRTQADYDEVCRRAGLDGNRPDQVKARAFLRAIAEKEQEGDPMCVDVNVQQPDQVPSISADDGAGVLARTAGITCDKCAGGGIGDDGQLCAECQGAGVVPPMMPTASQIAREVLDANVVKLGGYSICVNDRDLVEIRTPKGTSREASLIGLEGAVADFLKLASGANFEPGVNSQQDSAVNISDAAGGDVLGKDSQTDSKATDAMVPSGKPPKSHPAQDQAGTSATGGELGADTSTKDPVWGNPKVRSPHNSDPHDQSGTSFSPTSLGESTNQKHPAWSDPGPIQTSRKARLSDDSLQSDPASRYIRAMRDKPSARMLDGIGTERDWLARRAMVAVDGEKPVESKPERKTASVARALRDDLQQVGEGYPEKGTSSLTYNFAFDAALGQPSVSDVQTFVDRCCNGVREYRVAHVATAAPGFVRVAIVQADQETPSIGSEAITKRQAIRKALGKDLGNDPAGMGSDYKGTVLNKEGQDAPSVQPPPPMPPVQADAPPGWEDTTEKMLKHKEIDNPFALAWSMKNKGYEPGGSDKESQIQTQEVGKVESEKGVKPVMEVPSLAPSDTSGKTAQSSEPEYSEGYYDSPPARCERCGADVVTRSSTDGSGTVGNCDCSMWRYDPQAKQMKRQGARISENWGDGGAYKRDIEADSAHELWELHKGMGGTEPQFQQPQQAQMSVPIDPRKDQQGKTRLPEPEPEELNAARTRAV